MLIRKALSFVLRTLFSMSRICTGRRRTAIRLILRATKGEEGT